MKDEERCYTCTCNDQEVISQCFFCGMWFCHDDAMRHDNEEGSCYPRRHWDDFLRRCQLSKKMLESNIEVAK